jgi:hypothetical protein
MMDNRRLRSTNRIFLLALACSVAIGSFTCRPARKDVQPGTGGAIGQGGNGGEAGSGSSGSGSGGSESGGTSGTGGDGSGGNIADGTGGTTSAPAPCKKNSDCTNNLVCDLSKEICVECFVPTDCKAGQECKANHCVASAVDSGSDTPPAACTTATATPCANIPKLAGTQTLDGKGDDMCSVPSFQFNAQNAAKVIKYNSEPLEDVTVRVAWSAAGLHLFADVKDASVQSVNTVDSGSATSKAYQGDSLELFISSSNTVTGLTATDNNTLHVIVPATGPAVSVKTSNSGGSSAGTPTALPAAQYKQSTSSTGYAIEVLLPWPGGNPSAGTTVRFDMALNSADSTFGNVDNLRDGQMLFYIGTVSSTTCKSNDGTVPFCDDRTWCETKLQQ